VKKPECPATNPRSNLTVTHLAVQRLRRFLLITFGLACAGALFGGIAGGAGLAIALFFEPRWYLRSFDYYEFAASVGAVLGLVGAPSVTWIMLRNVPLGWLFTLLTLGTTASAVLGWFALSSVDVVWGPTLAGFAGFLATAIALSYRYDARPRLTQGRGAAGLIAE
jgi:hypothetical protein